MKLSISKALALAAAMILTSAAQADAPVVATDACPNVAAGETAYDCPWAGMARVLQAEAASGVAGLDMRSSLKDIAPMITQQIRRDRNRQTWLGLWGTSINFDANALGIIVDPPIIDGLLALADAPPRDDLHVCAGIQHTYGYLFSTLVTPYGYKRARWVAPDVVNGFGFTEGEISPTPKTGTLFSNLTYFVGKIVFPSMPNAMKTIDQGAWGIAPTLKAYDYKGLEVTRMVEELTVPRTVTIHTDFVKFPNQPANPDPNNTNTYLLIYSYEDPSDTAHPVKLISAFPISTGSFQSYTSGLGDNVVIPTRYNAYIPGITDSPTPLTGVKRILPSASN